MCEQRFHACRERAGDRQHRGDGDLSQLHAGWTLFWRGKRRIHAKPSLRVVRTCRPWLDAELAAVRPEVILCLGATAAQSFIGPRFSVTRNRGRVFETPWARALLVTYHPSAILRMDDEASQARAFEELVADLRLGAAPFAIHCPRIALAHLGDQLDAEHPALVDRTCSFIDGGEWVMWPNVLGMALFADDGRMSTKPYVAGGAYIHRAHNVAQSCGVGS